MQFDLARVLPEHRKINCKGCAFLERCLTAIPKAVTYTYIQSIEECPLRYKFGDHSRYDWINAAIALGDIVIPPPGTIFIHHAQSRLCKQSKYFYDTEIFVVDKHQSKRRQPYVNRFNAQILASFHKVNISNSIRTTADVINEIYSLPKECPHFDEWVRCRP